MFLKLLIISIFFMVLVFAGLGIRMLLKPNAAFPETHISKNPEMKKRGISCAQKTDLGCNPSEGNSCACSCSAANDL